MSSSKVYSVLTFEGKHQINSPRSLEACLRSGYDPLELVVQPERAFQLPGQPAAMTRMRFEHYEKRRQEKVNIVAEERKTIIDYLDQQQTSADVSQAEVMGKSREAAFQEQTEHLKSGMMEMERKRLEAVRRRQMKEINLMMENENLIAKMQAKIVAQEEKEEAKKREHEKKLEEKHADEAKKKRAAQMEKKAKEDEEAQQRREMAAKEAAMERAAAEQEAKDAKQRARDAREREIERQRRIEEHRAKTAAILKAQEDRAEESRRRMEAREKYVQDMMAEKKRLKQIEIAEARTKAEKRISDALSQNQSIQAQKRAVFEAKKARAQLRNEQLKIEEDERARNHLKELKKKEDLRLRRIEEANNIRQEKRSRIIEEREKKNRYYDVVNQQRHEELTMRRLQNDLHKIDRRENVQRIRRVDEFCRLQTLQKIQDDDERSERLKAEREFLLQQRKQTAHQNLLMKHRVTEAMEIMRVTNKFGDLNAILDESQGKKKRKKGRNMGRTESLPNLANNATP